MEINKLIIIVDGPIMINLILVTANNVRILEY